jgi:hypothetical protein
VDPNLLTSHILCLNETKIKNVHLNSKIYNSLSQKFHVLSCYDEHDIMVLYEAQQSQILVLNLSPHFLMITHEKHYT